MYQQIVQDKKKPTQVAGEKYPKILSHGVTFRLLQELERLDKKLFKE